jgi:hypothetical protein
MIQIPQKRKAPKRQGPGEEPAHGRINEWVVLPAAESERRLWKEGCTSGVKAAGGAKPMWQE